MDLILLHISVSLSYVILGALTWRELSRATSASGGPSIVLRRLSTISLIPIGLHLLLTHQQAIGTGQLHLGLGNVASLIAAITCLIYACNSLYSSWSSLPAFSLPFGAFFSILPIVDPATVQIPNSELFVFQIHLTLSVVAYSILLVALLHTVLLGFVEKKLHEHKLSVFIEHLPSLLSLEKLLITIIWCGFVALSLALFTGCLASSEIQNVVFPITHKTVFSLCSWITLGFLLSGHYIKGWRGKTTRKLYIASFTLLVLAYFGSRFVAEIILHHPQY